MLKNWDWFSLLVCVLAVYRLAQLVSIDKGPYDILAIIRQWFKKRAGNFKIAMETSTLKSPMRYVNWVLFETFKTLATGIECVYCTGVWFAFVATLYLHTTTIRLDYHQFFIVWLAIAGGQAFLQGVN